VTGGLLDKKRVQCSSSITQRTLASMIIRSTATCGTVARGPTLSRRPTKSSHVYRQGLFKKEVVSSSKRSRERNGSHWLRKNRDYSRKGLIAAALRKLTEEPYIAEDGQEVSSQWLRGQIVGFSCPLNAHSVGKGVCLPSSFGLERRARRLSNSPKNHRRTESVRCTE